jgi:hypothetical protein
VKPGMRKLLKIRGGFGRGVHDNVVGLGFAEVYMSNGSTSVTYCKKYPYGISGTVSTPAAGHGMAPEGRGVTRWRLAGGCTIGATL